MAAKSVFIAKLLPFPCCRASAAAIAGPAGCLLAVSPLDLPSSATQQHPRGQRQSEVDVAIDGILAASAPGQADWLTGGAPSTVGLPVLQRQVHNHSQGQQAPDAAATWMDTVLGEARDDAEAWLWAAPRRTSSDGLVLPIPWPRAVPQPCTTTTTGGASRHTTVQSARAAAVPVPSARPASARPATTSRLAPNAAEPRRQFPGAAAAAAGEGAAASGAAKSKRAAPASRPATAGPAATALSPSCLWRPTSSAAVPSSRQTLPGLPAATATPRAGSDAANRVRSLKAPPHLPQRVQQAQTPVQQAGMPLPGQISPVTKVSQWLHSGHLSIQPSDASRPESPQAGRSPSWCIPAASSSTAASIPYTVAPPPPPPAAIAAASSVVGSRIPRPSMAGALQPPSSSQFGSPPIHQSQRPESAWKQLAQRALAAGSASLPALPRLPHAHRPSSLRGAVTPSSRPGTPSKQTFHSAASGAGGSTASFTTASDHPGSVSPRMLHSCHRSSSSSLPLAKSPPVTSDSSGGSGGVELLMPLHQARAVAASQLQTAQAGARVAAEECSVLSRASPAAWQAAQTAAAAAPGSAAQLLDSQLEQLDQLSRCLSDAFSQVAEIQILEALSTSRRASSFTSCCCLSISPHSRPHSSASSSRRSQTTAAASDFAHTATEAATLPRAATAIEHQCPPLLARVHEQTHKSSFP